MSYEEDDDFQEVDGRLIFVEEQWERTEPRIKSLYSWSDPENVPLCIALCGTAGTGKKALARRLGQELDIPVIRGVARSAVLYGANVDDSAEWTDFMMILMAQLWQEREFEQYVSAGSLIELVAHAHYYAHMSNDERDLLILREMVNFIDSFINSHYSVIHYLPYEKRPRTDGLRSTNHKYNTVIDALIQHYLASFGIDYFPVQGTLAEKMRLCLGYLSAFGLR